MNIIPTDIKDWKIDTINELIKLRDIESEKFDFKGTDIRGLAIHLCAFTNTYGGFIVLGIDEIKNNQIITGFKKNGFNIGKEDEIKKEIRNYQVQIDPIPELQIKILSEDEKFFVVIEIENNEFNKPYFIKEKGICYVRIGSSSTPASRNVILNLFSSSVEQQKQVESLRIASEITKEAFKHALGDIHGATWESVGKIPPLDLTFLRNSVSSCEWFLRENNLLGKHTSQTGYEVGIHSILHDLEFLNVHIHAYNLAKTTGERQPIASFLQPWGLGSSYEEKTLDFLEKLITITEEFLKKYQ